MDEWDSQQPLREHADPGDLEQQLAPQPRRPGRDSWGGETGGALSAKSLTGGGECGRWLTGYHRLGAVARIGKRTARSEKGARWKRKMLKADAFGIGSSGKAFKQPCRRRRRASRREYVLGCGTVGWLARRGLSVCCCDQRTRWTSRFRCSNGPRSSQARRAPQRPAQGRLWQVPWQWAVRVYEGEECPSEGPRVCVS